MAGVPRPILTTQRTHRDKSPPPQADASFRALIDQPAKGTFTMPATARLYVYAPRGHFENAPSATITMPDGSSDVLTTQRMNPGERTVLGQTPFERGTVVTPATSLLVQIQSGYDWLTIAEG